MLILTRKIGESVMIGETVMLSVIDVKGHQVRLGFEAPKDVGVYREEVYERVKADPARAKPRRA